MARPETVMEPETFARVEALLPDDAVVMFSGLGEPLLNPHLETWVARLAARGISSCVITNGQPLTPKRQEKLIAAGLAQIQISYHATTPALFTSLVVHGGTLARLDAHLAHLARIRSATLRVRLNFVETPANAHDLDGVRNRAEDLGFDLFVRRLHNRGGCVDSPRTSPQRSGCGIFAAVTFITAQGDILSCVNDIHGSSRLARAGDLSWPVLVERRRLVVHQNRWFSACANCDDDYRWVILANQSVDVGGTVRVR